MSTADWEFPQNDPDTAPMFQEDDLSDLPDGAWIASEESDAGGRR